MGLNSKATSNTLAPENNVEYGTKKDVECFVIQYTDKSKRVRKS
jgi:hypothetical protein